MAHEFQSGLFFGENAWHGLGVPLPADSNVRHSIDDAIKISGLDWKVETAPLFHHAPRVPGVRSHHAKVEGFQAVRRKDTNAILGVVGERYHVLQNREQFDWFKPFLDAGEASFETCGALKNGTIVWVLARINRKDIEVQSGDVVRKYLLLTSSHDGSMATNVGFSPIRVVCWNTLSMALNGKSNLLKVRHTAKQKDALKAVRETINLLDQTFEATAVQYRRLAKCGIKLADLRKYVRLVLDLQDNDEANSTRSKNQLERIVQLCSAGVGQNPDKLTAWGAYNGVTQYITHEYGHSAETRLRSAWYGPGEKMNDKALRLALELAS